MQQQQSKRANLGHLLLGLTPDRGNAALARWRHGLETTDRNVLDALLELVNDPSSCCSQPLLVEGCYNLLLILATDPALFFEFFSKLQVCDAVFHPASLLCALCAFSHG